MIIVPSIAGHSFPGSLFCSEKKCGGSNAIGEVCKGSGRENKGYERIWLA